MGRLCARAERYIISVLPLENVETDKVGSRKEGTVRYSERARIPSNTADEYGWLSRQTIHT